MSNNVSSNELLRQSQRIQVVSEEMQTFANKIATYCDQVGDTVVSEDSNLSLQWQALEGVFETLGVAIGNHGSRLSSSLEIYAQATLQNEEEAARATEGVSEGIASVADAINNII